MMEAVMGIIGFFLEPVFWMAPLSVVLTFPILAFVGAIVGVVTLWRRISRDRLARRGVSGPEAPPVRFGRLSRKLAWVLAGLVALSGWNIALLATRGEGPEIVGQLLLLSCMASAAAAIAVSGVVMVVLLVQAGEVVFAGRSIDRPASQAFALLFTVYGGVLVWLFASGIWKTFIPGGSTL
jgi:hypothetical protein